MCGIVGVYRRRRRSEGIPASVAVWLVGLREGLGCGGFLYIPLFRSFFFAVFFATDIWVWAWVMDGVFLWERRWLTAIGNGLVTLDKIDSIHFVAWISVFSGVYSSIHPFSGNCPDQLHISSFDWSRSVNLFDGIFRTYGLLSLLPSACRFSSFDCDVKIRFIAIISEAMRQGSGRFTYKSGKGYRGSFFLRVGYVRVHVSTLHFDIHHLTVSKRGLKPDPCLSTCTMPCRRQSAVFHLRSSQIMFVSISFSFVKKKEWKSTTTM